MQQDFLDFGRIRINHIARQLFIEENLVILRNKEFCLMSYFLDNMDRVLSRTQILEEVWDRNIFCPTNTVDVHVSSLRQKLADFNCEKFIQTVHCIGYICTLNY